VFVPSLRTSAGPSPLPSAAEGRLQVWREQNQVCAYGYAADGARWIHVPDLATFRLGREVVAFTLPSAYPDLIKDAFERNVLPMAIQALGGEALHASGVVGSSGVVALCGESGTGKSTLACALSARGYRLWADDAVAFEAGDAAVVAVPLPFRLRLDADSAAALGDGYAAVSTNTPATPLAAAVILSRDRAGPLSVRPLTGGDALAAALEQGYCFDPDDPGRTKGMIEAYLELVGRVPIVEVRFEPGWERLDGVVGVLEQIAAN